MTQFMPVEIWNGRTRSSVSDQGDTAARVFSVVGAVSEEAAKAAVELSFGVKINAPYDPTDENNVLFCHSVSPKYQNSLVIELVANYSVPPCGYFQATTKPTDMPWRYEWGECIEEPAFDRDIHNNALLNMAGDPPDNPPTRTITKKVISIYANEPFYDYATAKLYENCTNSDTIQMNQPNGNTNTFPPGTMKCTSYKPARDFTTSDTHVPTVRTIEIYDPQDVSLTNPFQVRILNQGKRGWYYDSNGHLQRGGFRDSAGQAVYDDVLLNEDGQPIDPSYTVEGHTPQANPNSKPDNVYLESSADGKVMWIRYDRYKSVPFLPLLTRPGS